MPQTNKVSRFFDEIVKIKRFLRDPDSNIWSHDYIRAIYNDVQKDVQQKTGVLERVQILGVPPLYQGSYCFDWELEFFKDGETRLYKAFYENPYNGDVVTNLFDIELVSGLPNNNTTQGHVFSAPWEAFFVSDPGDFVKVKFPDDFHKSKYIAYNRDPLDFLDEGHLMLSDSSHKIRTGIPTHYFRDSDIDNTFVLYPRPSTVVWNDVSFNPCDPDFFYTYDWEATLFPSLGTGKKFTLSNAATGDEYVYNWEKNIDNQEEIGNIGMWSFEFAGGFTDDGILSYFDDQLGRNGLESIQDFDSGLSGSQSGGLISAIDDMNNIFLVYESMPVDVVVDSDPIDMPSFLSKYVDFGTISRCYGANNDGRIKSLSRYWKMRYDLGLRAIKAYMKNKHRDRNYRLTSKNLGKVHLRKRHAMLPSNYPAI